MWSSLPRGAEHQVTEAEMLPPILCYFYTCLAGFALIDISHDDGSPFISFLRLILMKTLDFIQLTVL
jgi:hypothetical protein